MLNQNKHRETMYNIIKSLFSNTSIGKNIAFKGGTAAYFFYSLTRFSVDLDFDIIGDIDNEKEFEENIIKILENFGKITDYKNKKNTYFFLLDYGFRENNIKLEFSKRKYNNFKYNLKDFFGTQIRLQDETTMFSAKLVALTERKQIANRDIFDIFFFFKNNFDLSTEVIFELNGLSLEKQLLKAKDRILSLNKNHQFLNGLGDLLDEKQKTFVRNNLSKELIQLIDFQLFFIEKDKTNTFLN